MKKETVVSAGGVFLVADSEEINVLIPPLRISPLEWELLHIKNVWHQPSFVRGQLFCCIS